MKNHIEYNQNRKPLDDQPDEVVAGVFDALGHFRRGALTVHIHGDYSIECSEWFAQRGYIVDTGRDEENGGTIAYVHRGDE